MYLKQKIKSYVNFIKDYKKFKSRRNKDRFNLNWKDRKPCLDDDTMGLGYDRQYIYHTAWAARILKEINPKEHTDISSISYFNTIISAFIPVRFYDFRPPTIELSNLQTGMADLTSLKFNDNSIESLSCMHTVEHLGLGRYGDNIDPEADLKAIKELTRVLAIRGSLLFVVPIGKPKIIFNAHRIYSYEQIVKYFSNLKVEEFTLIPGNPEDGGLVKNPSKELTAKQEYSAGCFWFKKIQS